MANLVPNPCAATDLTGWTTLSDATLARVTSVPGTTIPSPATTALRVDPDKAIECDVVSLGVLTEGDWLAWAVDLSPGAAEDGGTWEVDIYWYDGASYYAGDPTIVLEDAAVEDGWTHYEGTVQIPADCDGFGVYVTTFDQTTTYVYATLFSVAALVTVDQVTKDQATDWPVLVCLAVRDRGFDWVVAGQLARDFATDWTIVETNLVTADLATDWAVLTRVTRDLATDWSVARKTTAVPDPVADILAEFNSIDLNDGVHTHILPGASLGAVTTEYESLRSATGDWQQSNVLPGWVLTSIPVAVQFSSTGRLTAWVLALKAACFAGGTLTWQWTPDDVVRTYVIGSSSEPDVVEDNAYILQHRTELTLALLRWPS